MQIVAGENAKKMFDKGELDAGIISCGQGVGLAHDIPTVKELFDRMISEATEMAKNLAGD